MVGLFIHNYYQQPGGEDQIFATETALLEACEHTVVRYTLHNDKLKVINPLAQLKTTLWNQSVYRELRALIRRDHPQVIHFHNTFPLISPAAYYAARDEGVPVVQTLNNYRLLCPNALFFREGRVCEDCLGKTLPWPGIIHKCYRNSRAASAAVATMLTMHRILETWRELVDVYILALTEFARPKFIEGGLPEDRIFVKPNFIHPDPGPGEGRGGYALFVGRLSEEKGLKTMLSAWERLGANIPLKIVGDGPLAGDVENSVKRLNGVEYLGFRALDDIYRLMGDAYVLLFPSEWYEGLPRTIVEAFAKSTPVIASRLGAMESLIEHGRTGLHFRPGNYEDLAAQVKWAFEHPKDLALMRQAVRAEFEAKYTAKRNYEMLMNIYQMAIERMESRC